MARVNRGTPYRYDQQMVPIPGGSAIIEVLNVAVTNGAWTAILMPNRVAESACKSIICKMRVAGTWQLSHLATGARYYSVGTQPLAMDIAKDRAEVLFYVNPGADGVFEVILLD